MDYTRLGSSGMKVSRIALGCMSFGDTAKGFNEWALGDEAASTRPRRSRRRWRRCTTS
jgi:aryl-alcohol dehydrogenase-like predicted oxidoreductase